MINQGRGSYTDPRDLINKLYWDVFFEYKDRKLWLALNILWNMMYHLDYQYGCYPRVPNFNQEWAVNKSNIDLG